MRQLPPLSATRTTVNRYISTRPSPCIIIRSRKRKDSLRYIPATPVKGRSVCIIMRSWERERGLCYIPTPAELKTAVYT